ncbi:30S ribosomal protein S16 [bacterium]|nr:30S ribosomal protein S16 [bacterium]
MAVHIRLRRGGKKKQAHYRIVVADSRSPRDGRFLEIIGSYNPIPAEEEVRLNKERFTYWFSRGARPTDTVKSLLKRKGLWAEVVPSGVKQAKPSSDADMVIREEEVIEEEVVEAAIEEEVIAEEAAASEEVAEEPSDEA